MKTTLRYIVGYAIGFSLFVVLIPYGLYGLSRVDPILKINWPEYSVIRLILSLPLFIIGLIFAFWSNVSLFFIGKGGPTDGFNIAITPRTETLVVRGPYRYTRNPMVFGALSIYFSISLFFLSILCLLTMTIFSILIVFYLRKTEERRLLKDFGDEYIRYKKEVPMIFPKFHN